jgi:hypothetical protein
MQENMKWWWIQRSRSRSTGKATVIEFTVENGEVARLYSIQDKRYKFRKAE